MAMARDAGSRVVWSPPPEASSVPPIRWPGRRTAGGGAHRRAGPQPGDPGRHRASLARVPRRWLVPRSPTTDAVEPLRGPDRAGGAGHGADLRPGRHHRPPGPPGGLGLDRCRLRPRGPVGRAAVAGRRTPSAGPPRWNELNASLGVYMPGYPVLDTGRSAGGGHRARPGRRGPEGPGPGRADNPDDGPDRRGGRSTATPPGSARSRSSSGRTDLADQVDATRSRLASCLSCRRAGRYRAAPRMLNAPATTMAKAVEGARPVDREPADPGWRTHRPPSSSSRARSPGWSGPPAGAAACCA